MAAGKANTNAKAAKAATMDDVVAELRGIKLLLISYMIHSGVSQAQVGKALGMTQGNVSKMLSKGLKS